MSFFMKTQSESQHVEGFTKKAQHFSKSDNTAYCFNDKYTLCLDQKTDSPAIRDEIVKIFANMPDAVIVSSLCGTIQSVNRATENLFRYSQADIVGENISLFFTQDLLSNHKFRPSPAFDHGTWSAVTDGPANVARKKTGEIFLADISRCDYIIDSMPCCVYKISDASEIARLRERGVQAEREIALLSRQGMLGELTAAITHELSQPLTAIAGYTAAARNCYVNEAEDNSDLGLELVTKAGVQAQRAWQIVQKLRTLLQHRENDQKDSDLRATVKDATDLATLGALDFGVEVDVDLVDKPVIVRMDPVQIQILIANLIRNAIDELRVRSGEKIVRISLKVLPDDTAKVSVADNGPGIAKHVYENIFDPFLSTKPQGLGVGLALSRRIARAHQAHLSARNLEDGGAEFSLTIPVSVSK